MIQPNNDGINLHKPDPANQLQIDLPAQPHASQQHEVPSWVDEATRPSQTPPQAASTQPQPQPEFNNRQPADRPVAAATPWSITPQDGINSRKLVAGLLALFLGCFGVHKFYLGRTTPGLLVLLINVGGWFLTGIITLITFGLGGILLVPLMGLVSGALGIIGLIEGIVYLTRSDAEFDQTYVIGKKEWF